MKRLFIVDGESPEAFRKFMEGFREKAPNVVFLDYQTLFNTGYLTKLDINKYNPIYSKTLSYLDDYMFKYNKKRLIERLMSYIDSVDSPKSIIFLLCNHQPVIYHIKKAFNYSSGKSGTVKVIKFTSRAPFAVDYIYNKSKFPIKKHDIEININDINNIEEVKTKALYFYNLNIPIKLLNTL